MSGFTVVIPARYESERLPGKPLRNIGGKPMLQHVYERATESNAVEILIATDDRRIADVAAGFGAAVCMTRSEHRSGTERIAEVSTQNDWADEKVVVNLQGDEPMMPAALINQCAALLDERSVVMATLASPLASLADYANPNVVKVIRDKHGDAIYFSRSPIPYSRDRDTEALALRTALHHHGIYGYRCATLRRLVAAEPSDPEVCERLEQLRALSLGIRIRVATALRRPPAGVDTEADLAQAARYLSTK